MAYLSPHQYSVIWKAVRIFLLCFCLVLEETFVLAQSEQRAENAHPDSIEGDDQSEQLSSLSSSSSVHELGEFYIDADFYHPVYRPINVLPETRHEINVQFDLYTRDHPNEHHILKVNCQECLASSSFQAARDTKFIVHGWLDTKSDTRWMLDLTQQFLSHGDFNVIIVDWSGGNRLLYTQAVANARVVGAEIALLIDYLQNETGLDPSTCHIIGHSLGAHIAGYAGKRLNNLGRITGLDPAELFFQNMPATVRLDRSDAQFVDVIHTDSDSMLLLGLGMSQAVGHVDFYPNGGRLQPGCSRSTYTFHKYRNEGVRRLVSCDHLRSVDFFIGSIEQDSRGCHPVGFKCSSWDYFRRRRCTQCGLEGEKCAIMGWRAEEYKHHIQNQSRPVQMYLVTGEQHPYCVFFYEVMVLIGSSDEAEGRLTMYLNGRDGHEVPLGRSDHLLYPGNIYRYLVTTQQNFVDINDVYISWKAAFNLFGIFQFAPSTRIRGVRVKPLGLDIVDKDNANWTKWFCPISSTSLPPHDVEIESSSGSIFSSSENCQIQMVKLSLPD